MIIELLKSIFEENGYSEYPVDFGEYTCCLFSHLAKEEYFIILDKDTIIDNDLIQFGSDGTQRLYEVCRNLDVASETFEKNTTVLICINNPDIDNKICNELEEDTYLFKKNILIYQEEHVNELNELSDDDFSLAKLNELLNGVDQFEGNKHNNNSTYRLLTKLFIKLPFLSYQRENREMEDLSNIIREEANNKDLYSLYLQISNQMINTESLNSYDNIIESNLIIGDEYE